MTGAPEQPSSRDPQGAALETPLYALHKARGASLTAFAGYALPVSYPLGVLKEHLHTRAAAGLFDVSHMGQIEIRPRSGRIEDALAAVESVAPISALGIAPGRQRYGLLTNDTGGVLDDFMIARLDGRLILVANAARKNADFAHLAERIGGPCALTLLEDRALLALQGPAAEAALARLDGADAIAEMRFMDVTELSLLGAPCIVSRSGYTGEDGFEISCPADRAAEIADRLLAQETVEPIGLGARDSLRLEAGLCLYGSDLDITTSPVEAGLEWAIQKVRRPGGERAGGYPGAERIGRELTEGPSRQRVGLRPEGRAPMRAGVALYADEAVGEPCGVITSGGFGPSVEAPISMGYVDAAVLDRLGAGGVLQADLRGKRRPVRLAALPFIAPNYKRG